MKLQLEQIIEGCRAGNSDARRELYELYGAKMFGVVRRYVKDASTAEDLLHDGFVTLYMRMEDYRGEGSFEGWCRRIFVNTVLSYLRKKNPLNMADEVDVVASKAEISAKNGAIDELSVEEIKRCVDELPEGYKLVFNMRAVEDYSYDEIAKVLNISEVTVRSQYMRARSRLVELIKKRYGVSSMSG